MMRPYANYDGKQFVGESDEEVARHAMDTHRLIESGLTHPSILRLRQVFEAELDWRQIERQAFPEEQ